MPKRKNKTNRGGARPGAGRISIYGVNLDRHMIRIAPFHTTKLKEVDPNISQAVRNLLDDPAILAAINGYINKNNAMKGYRANDTGTIIQQYPSAPGGGANRKKEKPAPKS